MRRRIYIGAGALAALVAAFVAGRFSRPPEVREVVKVERQTVTEWKDRVVYVEAKKKRATTTTTKKPTGEVVIVRVEETDTDRRSDTASDGTLRTYEIAKSEKVTKSGRPGWAVAVGGTWDPRALSLEPERYRLGLDRRLVGTLWLSIAGSAPQDFNLKRTRVDLGIRMEF